MKAIPCFKLVSVLAAAVVLSNCAGTTPKADYIQPFADNARIASGDKVSAKVTSSDPNMLPNDQKRMGEKILHKVNSIAQSNTRPSRKYELAVTISRYEKGNAFARAMLAGLGQIHIDGNVVVYQQPGGGKVAEFALNKTFAWGGIYGGTVTMDAIEDTYAEAVAEAVCQGK